MATPVRMPPLGQTSDELRIVAWLGVEGAEVVPGQPLLAVETDKAELEVEATAAGTLLRIVHTAGETVRAGTVVAWVGEPGETPPGARVEAAPAVRKLAHDRGVDLAAVTGSGPGGRILREDVLAGAGATGDEPVPRHRRALAARLARSTAIPQFAVGVTVDMRAAAGERVTTLLLGALASALREHPEVNRLWIDDGPRIRRLERVDVGLAVAGEDTLLVVTIPEPDRLDDLSGYVDRVAADARAGRLSGASRAPAAVTLSNLGGVGVDRFTALLDPGRSAILAAGRVLERPVVVDGRVAPAPQLDLTLTADHRILDGVAAGRFLDTVRRLVETRG
jgi:pyruvate dehydrogenase E2 component (dihydrolipoyllysine-residue acetyltransferase)